MRVLVTGGAGYIGSHTAAALLAAGHEVVVLDALRTTDAALVPDGAAFVRGDVANPSAWLDDVGPLDACLHFAALIEAGESMRVPQRFFATNTAGSLRLAEALVDAGVSRFVLSSTAAVYGEPQQVPITEDHPLDPTNAYGESKLLVERALGWLAACTSLRTAVLRYFNAAGATAGRGERHDPETHLIPLVLQAATGARPNVRLFGTDYPTADGTCVRDYVHVADLADAHVLALEALTDHRTLTCNLGSETGSTVREVIDAVQRVTGRTVPVVEAPRRDGDPAVLVASAARARSLLGWSPARGDLDTIVADAHRWHSGAPPV